MNRLIREAGYAALILGGFWAVVHFDQRLTDKAEKRAHEADEYRAMLRRVDEYFASRNHGGPGEGA